MALKDYPNNRFGWFLDNETQHGARVCILVDRASTDTTNKNGNYDTYNETSITDGIRIHYHAKYPEVNSLTDDLSGFGTAANSSWIDSGLHSAILDYVKARIEEDHGAFDKAGFFMNKYKQKIHKYPHRKSGVRQLSVPNI
jgi:hypothetical protein|tara:strand:+ start:147 stop:569 length:423 start_codon:yes stop_codon:yes gene_type:complete